MRGDLERPRRGAAACRVSAEPAFFSSRARFLPVTSHTPNPQEGGAWPTRGSAFSNG